MRKPGLAWLGILVLVLAACGPAAGQATPAPLPTATRAPAGGAAIPTATAAPGPTAAPAATPVAVPSPTPKLAAAGPKYGGTLRVTYPVVWPRGYDGWKFKMGGNDIRIHHNMNFSALFVSPNIPEADCRLTTEPDLAESWKWMSDTLLEVKIRQGVKFHNKPPLNGRELTAEDVAWSLNQAFFKEPIRGIKLFADHTKKIEATDRYTIRFVTDQPMGLFISDALASNYGAVIVPREVVEPYGNWDDPTRSYVGTGPFTFKESRLGVSITYEKHPNYFKKGLPYLDTLRWVYMPEASTEVAALRAGNVDLISNRLPMPMAQALMKVPRMKVQSCPAVSSSARYYFHVDEKPFSDVRVRRALSMALDRRVLVDAVLQGFGEAAPLYPATVSPLHVTWDELPPEVRRWVTYDPSAARELLKEAGYPSGLEFTMVGTKNYPSPYPETAQAMVDMWGKAGFKVNYQPVEHAVWEAYSREGNFKGMLQSSAAAGSISSLLESWHSKSDISTNRHRVKDPQVDSLIEEFMRTTDSDKATKLFKQLETRLIDQGLDLTSGPFQLEFMAGWDYVRDFRGGDQYPSRTWAERVWLDR